ncbi:MAG: UDP-N-acetylmuramate--L-alanine ligase [Roseburia sp.]|nr:UDP-N-acetylmuramate--L-alanine ligase [Roseburia sp.]MCM1279955.1 UDP-N-acetylmuramate--L-alanine ligase [Robinsoniella sp.]
MYNIDFSKPISIHFIGIGGISMSGLAEILADRSFIISGSDAKKSPLTESLERKGVIVYYGQNASNITDSVQLVVYTAAIHEDNPELQAAKAMEIPCMTRAELLGQIMKNYALPIAISGTHGKTTTTSMVSEILLAANMDPTLSIGGILKSIGGNIRIGASPYFVTEACEYTNSFLSFFPKVSLILNVEEDHMDFFKDIEQIRDSFHRFAKLLPKDGTLIINGDIKGIDTIISDLECTIITYGSSPKSDYYPKDITYDELARPSYTLCCSQRVAGMKTGSDAAAEKITLGVTGEHNVLNSLAAIALADLLGISRETTAGALLSFHGTDRRFEVKGRLGEITILDDYAHHPTEIRATLQAAQKYPHKDIWCVFQPHTYTRTKAFLNDFASALSLADHVVLTDIYAAREKNTIGISSMDLLKEIEKLGTDCCYFPSFDEIENFLLENCSQNDLLITMGAGDVVKIGEKLLGM